MSYFWKNPLGSLLSRSDSMSLFRVSFSLRSWKVRKGERQSIGEKSAEVRTRDGPVLLQKTGQYHRGRENSDVNKPRSFSRMPGSC